MSTLETISSCVFSLKFSLWAFDENCLQCNRFSEDGTTFKGWIRYWRSGSNKWKTVSTCASLDHHMNSWVTERNKIRILESEYQSLIVEKYVLLEGGNNG